VIYGKLGSISHATLRSEDLLPVYAEHLRDLAKANVSEVDCRADVNAHLDLCDEVELRIDDANDNPNTTYWQSDECCWDSEALYDALQQYAPPYTYFGAHEGDGSDFGFWPCLDGIDDDVTEVLKVADIPCYLAHVSDHGNITFYEVQLTELWSCV
jgi:hypothetical protein